MSDYGRNFVELPTGDNRYSLRWKLIKSEFSRRWLPQVPRAIDAPYEQPERRVVGGIFTCIRLT